MNKAQIVYTVAKKTGLSQVDVAHVFKGILFEITKSLSKGGSVELRGFGTFKCVKRSARNAMNPRTREPISVEAKIKPSFKPSPNLKDAVMGVDNNNDK
jgi:nucleoid DNA-binding protein